MNDVKKSRLDELLREHRYGFEPDFHADEIRRLFQSYADLMKAAAKVNTWIKTHPRKATIVQSVKDELDAALSALPPEELSK